jgi:hypothetical protein
MSAQGPKAAVANSLPDHRAVSAFPILQEMMDYATTQAVRGKLKPGSWAEADQAARLP